MLPEVEGPKSAGTVAQKLLAAMKTTTFAVAGQELNVTFSVGGAVFPDHAGNVDELLARASA